MKNTKLSIPLNYAKVILEMESICYQENQVSMDRDSWVSLMMYIKEHYPTLAKEYSYFEWEDIEREYNK